MYEVIVSPEAEADLDRIVRYIAIDLGNPPAATSFADKVEKRLVDLETMPSKYSFCKDDFLRAMGYHRVHVGNYLLIYRIDESARCVFIVHVYHTLQDYESDLLHFASHLNSGHRFSS